MAEVQSQPSQPQPTSQLKIACIGAGPSGLSLLRAFQSAQSAGIQTPQIVCFEKQSNWGGQWNSDQVWRVGLDANGESAHSSMYRYLWSNGPKEALEFADYSFDEHFGKDISSYPPRAVLFDYIQGRVDKAGVRKYIRFNTAVRNVDYNDETKQFTVRVHDYANNQTYSEVFDYVVVASGHFSTPNTPYFKGFEQFHGRILHAHDFRDARQFKDKTIMLIGSSYSAEDIGSQCYKYGCKQIYSTYRSEPMGFKWPSNWTERGGFDYVDADNVAHFKDGSTSEPLDAIILCTGYNHYYPFLSDELRLSSPNLFYPLGLYQGVVWETNPKLFYIGAQDQWYTFNMFDAQTWFVRDVILNRIALPDLETMQQHSATVYQKMEKECQNYRDSIKFQGDYIKSLIEQTDYPTFDVDQVNNIFYQWMADKIENIMTFRDQLHQSVITNKMAKPHHTSWMNALDDSFAAYLADEPSSAQSP